MIDINRVFPEPDMPITEAFDVSRLLTMAFALTADATLRDEDDDHTPTNATDMYGFAELAYRWFEIAVSKITPDQIEPPRLLIYHQCGEEVAVNAQRATAEDFDATITSRMAEAMACMAGAWQAIQQAAAIDATRPA